VVDGWLVDGVRLVAAVDGLDDSEAELDSVGVTAELEAALDGSGVLDGSEVGDGLDSVVGSEELADELGVKHNSDTVVKMISMFGMLLSISLSNSSELAMTPQTPPRAIVARRVNNVLLSCKTGARSDGGSACSMRSTALTTTFANSSVASTITPMAARLLSCGRDDIFSNCRATARRPSADLAATQKVLFVSAVAERVVTTPTATKAIVRQLASKAVRRLRMDRTAFF
jgi:hypothetical protein